VELAALNGGFKYTERIDGRGAGRALVDYLASRYAHSSAAEWRERIEAGLVLVEGSSARAEDLLRAGQALTWARPPWEEPATPMTYAVLHEDAALLAVEKPAGLPTLPGGGYLEHTLLALVRKRNPGATPMHRLGRGTSGVVLFALTAHASRVMASAWRGRRVIKDYRALVDGSPERDAFPAEAAIGLVFHPVLGAVWAARSDGKPSRSEVRVIERRGTTSLVEVRIKTGRPHQIRIHMAACGHPLAGDSLYAAGGGLRGKGTALPGDTGYLLHAMRVALSHPETGKPFEVKCPPPRELRGLLEPAALSTAEPTEPAEKTE
jgi:23S rRNA pseudouridine1911/1915/1917 synthase